MKIKNVAKYLIAPMALLVVGCSSASNGIMTSSLSTNELGQVCVEPNSRANLHKLVEKVSKKSNSNYQYQNEKNDLELSYLTFEDKECFSSIVDLKTYIDNNTDFKLNVSKVKREDNYWEKGFTLRNAKIIDAINYINSTNNTRIEYFDENITLKDSNVKIYSFKDLYNYIVSTTPYYLREVKANLSSSNKKSKFYTLGYLVNKVEFDKSNEVVSNLNKAKHSLSKTMSRGTIQRLDEVIEEMKNFD
ncbi:hypothetical protein [Poseidonibacter ostreae]|uniref:Lipoprotein n=1 Tax=Poseidonibacter ostreae TaxID=2654171 RepID=A0A6L4WW71_9BACT|nr:hypothetical protein [Poseidonibacter ostreae]KAB7891286.1 hypothetical protein GBG19_00185 [Poseidonibacter ostreae]